MLAIFEKSTKMTLFLFEKVEMSPRKRNFILFSESKPIMREYCDLAEGIWEIIQTAGYKKMSSRGAKLMHKKGVDLNFTT